ncbi:hypothetical protein GCM10011512_09810 [Tersicoccus solisilvae]|uniref:Uncharacterized protein n=1 Tax=Tersicoccus solisilvae TaxID=1882339 RepID=A0ABQ1NTV8_9MICC|nr:hypothetical protein [Tersicoccus solisilvae]GGC84990.1 hypothetical protein GCM10011512_09810 [Tersicoccus solisilvae]
MDGDALLAGLTATGQVRAPGAHIGGQLYLREVALSNPDGDALNLDRIQVDGGAFGAALTATGQVRAVGAHIGGRTSAAS